MTDFKLQILKDLETLRKADHANGKKFQAIAYGKAIAELKKLPTITSLDQVKGVSGVGEKIFLKIQEILTTGALKAATEARSTLALDALDSMQGIHGVGPVKARELVNKKGLKTIQEVRAKLAEEPDLLNDVQKLGLKYYEDSQERIPRAEMAEHESILLSAFEAPFEAVVVGSYRRGAVSSGDIDVLLTLPDSMKEKARQSLFHESIKLLHDAEYVCDTLAEGPKKFMGYVRLGPGYKARRLDLLMVPAASFACAILYFTGSQEFNTAFRAHALACGYTLNEHRLEKTEEGKTRGVKDVPVFATEKDIFDFLGLQFIEPTSRRDANDIKTTL